MSDLPINPSSNPFDQIRHEDEQGEWWSARELMQTLQYSTWQKFEEALKRAMTDCIQSNRNVDSHFNLLVKSTPITGGRAPKDYRLTRYACRLVVMASKTPSDVAALARTYFSDKVDQAEDADFAEWRQRAIASYVNAGYSVEWATRRVDGITTRNALTHEWFVRGIEGDEFAILTDHLHMNMFGLSIQSHMALKDFPVTYKGKRAVYKGDLRPSLTAVELAITALGETVARELHIARDSQGFAQISHDVADAGRVAADARRQVEALTGQPVVSPRNMLHQPDGGLWVELPAPKDHDA